MKYDLNILIKIDVSKLTFDLESEPDFEELYQLIGLLDYALVLETKLHPNKL